MCARDPQYTISQYNSSKKPKSQRPPAYRIAMMFGGLADINLAVTGSRGTIPTPKARLPPTLALCVGGVTGNPRICQIYVTPRQYFRLAIR